MERKRQYTGWVEGALTRLDPWSEPMGYKMIRESQDP